MSGYPLLSYSHSPFCIFYSYVWEKGKTAFSALYHVVTLHYHHNEIEKDEKEKNKTFSMMSLWQPLFSFLLSLLVYIIIIIMIIQQHILLLHFPPHFQQKKTLRCSFFHLFFLYPSTDRFFMHAKNDTNVFSHTPSQPPKKSTHQAFTDEDISFWRIFFFMVSLFLNISGYSKNIWTRRSFSNEIFSIFLFLLHRHLLFPFQHHFHFPVGILQTNMLYIHSLLPIILFKYLINFSFSSYRLNIHSRWCCFCVK